MKISLNWLKTLLSIDRTPAEIEAILTATGLEVENYEITESVKGGLEGLVIGSVVTCDKHPNADKLKLCKVDAGSGELLSIVCGAPNVEAGQKVIVAKTGTTVYPVKGDPFVIQKAKIRGEYSEGMLCAADEVGLGDSHDGLLILEQDAPIGKKLSEHFEIKTDVVFEIGLTANRGDAASHLGVARELATVLNVPFKLHAPDMEIRKTVNALQVDIEDPLLCPRYSGIIIDNVEVQESPEWLKERLKSIGLKPVNNVVDVTNFVMHELGQPMHAYDYNKIGGKKIKVRLAEENEKFITLDGTELKLRGTELLVCDTEKGMCLAGIYGGKESGVDKETKKIFLESAYFTPENLRKSAKYHGLSTDSSFRFERGTDPDMTIHALKRAAQILKSICNSEVVSEVLDLYPNLMKPFEITLRKKNIERVTGIKIPEASIEQILPGLGITINEITDEEYKLSVPRFKSDVYREIDVIEELLRIYGFMHIPLKQHMEISLNYKPADRIEKVKNKLNLLLAGMGFSEIMTNSLSSDKYYEARENLVYLSNPLSAEMNVLRGSMLYSTLESIAHNKNRKQANTHFFEFGKTYENTDKAFSEREQLILAVSGNVTEESWEIKQRPVDNAFLRSVVRRISEVFKIQINSGTVIEVDAKTLKMAGIKDPVFYCVIEIAELAAEEKTFELKPVPVFPVVRRDLSLVLDDNVTYEQVMKLVNGPEFVKINNTNVFDLYKGKPLEEGKKAMSISFDLYDNEKTMTDGDIDPIMDKLIEKFEKELNAVIRR